LINSISKTKENKEALKEESNINVVILFEIIAEIMLKFVILKQILIKFSDDNIQETLDNYNNYLNLNKVRSR